MMGAVSTGAGTITTDEFLALEQKVLRAVTMIREERELRAAAEAELSTAQSEIGELQAQLAAANTAHTEVEALTRDREAVRQRVEKMLAQIDELL